jgi:hypothetical protein
VHVDRPQHLRVRQRHTQHSRNRDNKFKVLHSTSPQLQNLLRSNEMEYTEPTCPAQKEKPSQSAQV